MQPLLLWNDTKYAQNLAALFGKDLVVTNNKALANAAKNWEKYTSLVVLCELNWKYSGEMATLQSFQGIELVKRFRREGVTLPIIFTSFLSRKQVYANKLERGIINAVGHDFIQLPYALQQLKKEEPKVQRLNELEMYDIVHNYCSLGGVIKMLLHSLSGLQGALNNPAAKPESVRSKIRDAIIQAHQVFGKDSSSTLAEFDSKFTSITINNLNKAIRFAEETGNELVELYAAEEESNSKLKAKGNWKLLLLDDEITEKHILIDKLKERDVQVICCRNAHEADKIINKETLLSLVISDYRLEDEVDGVNVQQPIQGYQFLKDISDHKPGYLRLAALSSLPRRFLMESFKHYGLRVEIFSKKDYLENE